MAEVSPGTGPRNTDSRNLKQESSSLSRSWRGSPRPKSHKIDDLKTVHNSLRVWRQSVDKAADRPAKGEQKISQKTADYYYQRIEKFLEFVEGKGGGIAALEKDPVRVIRTYLDEKCTKRRRTAELSVVVRKFLPVVRSAGLINTDAEECEKVFPLRINSFLLPVMQHWMEERYPDCKGNITDSMVQRRKHLRRFLIFAAGRIRSDLIRYSDNVRPFVPIEEEGELRALLWTRRWEGVPLSERVVRSPSFDSVTECVLFDPGCVKDFASDQAESSSNIGRLAIILSTLRGFYDWAHELGLSSVSGNDIINPLSTQIKRPKKTKEPGEGELGLASSPGKRSQLSKLELLSEKMKNNSSDKVVDQRSPSEKLLELSRQEPLTFNQELVNLFLEHRDRAITIAVQEAFNIGEIDSLRQQDISFGSNAVRIRCRDFSKWISLSSEAFHTMLDYSEIFKKAVKNSGKLSPDAPLFPSVGGGSLLAGRESESKRPQKGMAEILQFRDKVVTAQMQQGGGTFSEVRKMSFPQLEKLAGDKSYLERLVRTYVEVLRQSPLGGYATGPGLGYAFPSSDGGNITDD